MGGIGLGFGALVTSSAISSCSTRQQHRMDFSPVNANTEDTISLPEGFNWHVVCQWGDGLWSNSIPFDETTCGTAQSQSKAMGDNNDGMALFEYQGKIILAVNNEYSNNAISFAHREAMRPETEDDIRKSKAAHGVTILEIKQLDGRWKIVEDSKFNRKITADSEMELTGPARNHKKLKTSTDPNGELALGTWANCGSGRTPWGTYLTCEENFQGYFSSSDKKLKIKKSQRRYGIGKRYWGNNWDLMDPRFDLAKTPNEPNRCGFVVEIDPLDPDSIPKKRTALGRLSHENAELVVCQNGSVVVYMGDDARGEYLYRFISEKKLDDHNPNPDLLENGELFAAKFNDDGTGVWLKLSPKTTGMKSKAKICINTRSAADKVGATTMDRPEWVAANPITSEVFCTLTNNKHRGERENLGGEFMAARGPNPRANNIYGHILRWRPKNNDHESVEFDWDFFAIAGNPEVHNDEYAGSENINRDNMFNSPDGLKFDQNGNLWIQTDGVTSNLNNFEGMGNNQMLIADAVSGDIRRFMVGPNGCEITGLVWSPDFKTAFVGIQHPGIGVESHFPNGGSSVPRSCIIAIQRDDGEVFS